MTITNLCYSLLCLSVSVIIGTAIFEHLVVWPQAYAAPPSSLTMFQGEFGLHPGKFWQKIHPITILLFLINLKLSWSSERKLFVLIPFIGYLIIMVITTLYFVPELIEIVSTPFTNDIDESLVRRGSLWQLLSLVRLLIMIVLVLYMYLGLTKSSERKLATTASVAS